MAIHGREVWQDPRNPVRGPRPKQTARSLIFHWPGSSSVPTSFAASCDSLRAMQRDYTTNRGYSLGYSWAITRDGHAIEVRGDDFNNAANKGDKVTGNANDWSRSILMFCGVNTQKQVTPAQVAAVHELLRARNYGSFEQQVHMDVDYTSCAGPDVSTSVRTGVFRVGDTPPPPTGDDEVVGFLWHHTASNKPGVFWVANGSVVRLDAQTKDILVAQGFPWVRSDNDEVYYSYVRVTASNDLM